MRIKKTLTEIQEEFKIKQPKLSKEIKINKIFAVNKRQKLIVTTKYGVCNIDTSNLLKGVTPKIQTAINKTIYFNSMLKYEQPEIYDSIVIMSNYVDTDTHLLVMTKYGLCDVYPTNLIKGRMPTIRSARHKREFFVNQAREVHGDKYDYTDSEYVNATKNIDIWCRNCNKYFNQSPHSHVDNSAGCPECAKKNSYGFYNITNAERNKEEWSKIKATIYIIVCKNDEEEFFKIGITTKDTIKERFNGCMPYDYEIIEEIETSLYEAVYHEKNLHKINIKIQYTPKIQFGGMYECFKRELVR